MPFTGRAIYDTLNGTNVFDGVAEDVSDLITMISPAETPLLDRVGDADFSAKSVLHEWLEDALNPSTIIATTALAATNSTTALLVDASGRAMAPHLQVGMQIKVTTSGEFIQITAIDKSNNVTAFSRGFGSTTATTYAAGAELFILGPVALEGSDVAEETGRARVRKSNYCQIFKKDVIVSGTLEAVTQLGGVGSEFDRQKTMRMRELLRDLEKTIVHGKVSGNSLGSGTAYRTMKGLWDTLTTNVVTTGVTSVTPGWLNDVIKEAWTEGDVPNLIVCDANWRAIIDGFNTSRIEAHSADEARVYRNRVTLFESSYGTHEVVTSRWMNRNSLMVLSTDRIKVVPLTGRSFQFLPIARTGDSQKGTLLGEYTLEVRNEDGMVKAYGV
jgi:hypothetical protein